jgi:hypothetical protein
MGTSNPEQTFKVADLEHVWIRPASRPGYGVVQILVRNGGLHGSQMEDGLLADEGWFARRVWVSMSDTEYWLAGVEVP